ncbi:MAG: hypothetical protein ACM3WT_08015 [Bacillota bacterium]
MPKILPRVLLAIALMARPLPSLPRAALPTKAPTIRLPRPDHCLVSTIKDRDAGVRPDLPLRLTINKSLPGWRGIEAVAVHAPFTLEVTCNGKKERIPRNELVVASRPFSMAYLPPGGWKPEARYSVVLKIVSLPVFAARFTTGPQVHEPAGMRVEPPTRVVAGEPYTLQVRLTDHYGLPAWGVAVDVYAAEHGHRLEGSLKLDPVLLDFEEQSGGVAAVTVSDTEAERVVLSFSPRNNTLPAQTLDLVFAPGPVASVTARATPRMALDGDTVAVSGRVEDRAGNPCPDSVVEITCRSVASSETAKRVIVNTDDGGEYEGRVEGTPGVENEIAAQSDGISSTLCPVIWYSPGAGAARSYSLLVRDDALDALVSAVVPRRLAGLPGAATPGNSVSVSMGGSEIASGTAAEDGSFDLFSTVDMPPGSIVTVTESPAGRPVVYSISGSFGWGSIDPDEIQFELAHPATIEVSYHTTETVNREYHEQRLYFTVSAMGGSTKTYDGGGDYRIALVPGRYTVAAKSSLGNSRAVLKVTVPCPG